MNSKLMALVIAPFILLSSHLAAAEEAASELNFLGGTTLSYKNLSFVIPGPDGVSFEPHLTMIGLSGTWSYGSAFMTVNFDRTVKDDAQYAPGNGALIMMNRDDKDISLGYYLGKGVSIYAGYKEGVLKADVTGETTGVVVMVDPDGGGPLPPAPQTISVPVNPYQVKFSDKGGFIGASYVYNLAESSITLNAAYADLEGEVFFGSGIGSYTNGATTGYSASVAWNIPITDATIFTSKLNAVRYEFNDEKLGVLNGKGKPQDMSYSQDFDIINLSIAHYF